MCMVVERMDYDLGKVGEKLQKLIQENPKEGELKVIEYTRQIVDAYMRSLYENNVAHKDLKPDNILVKVVDGK